MPPLASILRDKGVTVLSSPAPLQYSKLLLLVGMTKHCLPDLFAMVQLSTAESDTNQLAGTYWTMYIRGMQVMKKNIFPVRM